MVCGEENVHHASVGSVVSIANQNGELWRTEKISLVQIQDKCLKFGLLDLSKFCV